RRLHPAPPRPSRGPHRRPAPPPRVGREKSAGRRVGSSYDPGLPRSPRDAGPPGHRHYTPRVIRIEPTMSPLKPADNRVFMLDARAETMPRGELAALQTARLQQTLRLAYESVQHFREKFDAARVRPSDCRALADITRFPFTEKADLRDHYPFGMFAVPREKL